MPNFYGGPKEGKENRATWLWWLMRADTRGLERRWLAVTEYFGLVSIRSRSVLAGMAGLQETSARSG